MAINSVKLIAVHQSLVRSGKARKPFNIFKNCTCCTPVLAHILNILIFLMLAFSNEDYWQLYVRMLITKFWVSKSIPFLIY